MHTGIANVPLHGGQCPPWLFKKMKQNTVLAFLRATFVL
ncbi:MAG: DUF763 domain-containing protein [Thermoanaerobacterales bacterium]|nr:DUF763 domain-containing protein [Thermoanaerobacterales bacterium]